MLRTTLAGLRLHTSRYVTTVLAILLGVMFVSGTMVFADTLNANYEESVMGSAGSVDAIATPAEAETGEDGAHAGPEPLTADDLAGIRALPEVAEADGLVRGQAVLLDADGRALGFTPPAAVSIEGASRFDAGRGELPSTGDEIALATSTAEQSGFGVGDTVTVLGPDREEHEFEVTGLVNFGVDPSFGISGAVVFAPDTVEEMTGATGYSEIDAIAAEGYTDEQVADAVSGVLGSSADVSTGEEYGLEMAEGVGAQTEIFRVALLLFAFIAMFVAGIVIYNTFAILIAQRQRELALLRCVGAKRSQVFRSVLLESAVVGLVASALGVLAGVGIGVAGAALAAPAMGADGGVPVVVTQAAVLTGLGVGTVVTVLSAMVPALRATRVAPLAALRTSTTASGIEKGTGWFRVVFGLVTFAVAGGLVALTQISGPTQMGLVVVTAAALVSFTGVVVLGPLLVRWIVRLVGLPLRRVGVASMLAVDNSVRSPRRAATAMIALTVGATLITGYSVVSASTESTLNRMLEEQFPVDYQITPQFSMEEPTGAQDASTAEGGDDAASAPGEGADAVADTGTPEFGFVPEQVRRDLEDEPSVGAVFGQRGGYVEDEEHGLISLVAFTGARMGVDLAMGTVEGDLSDAGPGRIALVEGHADGVRVGDTYTLANGDAVVDLEVAAIVEPGAQVFHGYLHEDDLAALFPDVTRDEAVLVRGAQDADPAELREAVYGAVEDDPTLQVMSVAEIKEQFSDIMDIAFYTITAMLGLAIVIAVFGISNTMALSVLERTRESALLRALGLARGQLRRMLSVEAVLLCLIGAGIGIVLGVVFGWAAAASVLPGLVFSLPAGQIAVFIAVAVLAGLLASILPGRRAAGTSITGALASE
ncbi:cell division protein FtsX [Nocardiopsis sp. CNR-923]|uniref:ABC transporter permease n=1 Tax=Nocardiopsis sp. CNR-923 TaxID=1904965 RepID=UPI000968E9B5|nr:FtsX-like permease family protein [Nocardiopsis sp. CNR-923]OLT29935.1 cell division protein FtsX [Nocardiopsis sp. CNR-923]